MFEPRDYVTLVGGVALGAIGGWLLGRSQNFSSARRVLNGNQSWMTKQDLYLASGLVAAGHGHLLSYWPPPGSGDPQKRDLMMMLLLSIQEASTDLERLRIRLIAPPFPQKVPRFMPMHGDVRDDPYYWMRDDSRRNPLVLSHLKAENAYTEAVMADTVQLQNDLYKEISQRTQEVDMTVPTRIKNYYYYQRTVDGKYRDIHCRRRVPDPTAQQSVTETMDMSVPEEILLDENEEAKRKPFYDATCFLTSPNERFFSYLEDVRGNEFYTLKIKEIRSGKQLLKNEIHAAGTHSAWSSDSKAVFYLILDFRGRAFQVWRHYLRDPVEKDRCIHEESDPSFVLSLYTTRNLSSICISASSGRMSETRILDAARPEEEPRVVLPRQPNVHYRVECYQNSFILCVQDEVRLNSEIVIAPLASPETQSVLVPHQSDRKIENFVLHRRYLTIFCRRNGLQTAFVYMLPHDIETVQPLANAVELKFEEAVFSLTPGKHVVVHCQKLDGSCVLGVQGDFDSEIIRLVYTSLVTRESYVDQHLGTFEREVKKMVPVLGDYDETNYRGERTWALASDGVRIPISLVYRIDAVRHDGTDPLVMEVYGAYEISKNPTFLSERVSLLERGIVVALAHVRGGGELGRGWYENGRLLKKKNTFTDTIACAKHLVDKLICSPSKLCISGRSSGGVAVGAVVNMHPELFCAAVMHVPFVDVLTSMSDAGIPLTTEERDEWGNPEIEEHYKYIRSYSPMDNIKHQPYPHMLITGGFHDFRVGYWEPAKYAAKIRDFRTNSNMVLFKCDMDLGHFSNSDQFWRKAALDYAFLLKALDQGAGQQ